MNIRLTHLNRVLVFLFLLSCGDEQIDKSPNTPSASVPVEKSLPPNESENQARPLPGRTSAMKLTLKELKLRGHSLMGALIEVPGSLVRSGNKYGYSFSENGFTLQILFLTGIDATYSGGRRLWTGRLIYRAELYGKNASLFNRLDAPGIPQVRSDLPPVNSGSLGTIMLSGSLPENTCRLEPVFIVEKMQ